MNKATYWNGQEEFPTMASFWTGTEEASAEISAMPTGYTSVASMLTAEPFYVAHRGGSVDWPEMSLRGQTESVSRGVGALEISLSRSSDGVWFGLHDETFNRTASMTNTPLPATLTWEQINNTYPNKGDRYYTLQELIEPWSDSHVFLIDPKYNFQRFANELGPLIKTLVPASRVVIKYFGDNNNLANAAKAQGFTTWGYFYGDNIASGVFEQKQAAWDILGLDYTATQEQWDIVLAKGKPVIGHICPTNTAVNTALAKGAHGVMVSGIKSRFGVAGL